MKSNTLSRYIILLAISITTLISCNKEDDNNTVDEVSDTVKEGTWKVGYFNDSTEDKTPKYAGYSFTFIDNSILTATKEGTSYTGVWSVSKSNTDDDLFSTKFLISFGSPDLLIELSDDWKVIENTGSSLKLKDDSKGDSAIEYLTFEKI